MLVSKTPYVVEPRQNLTLKNPHLALKTGERISSNLLLKILDFYHQKNKERSYYLTFQTKIIPHFTLLPPVGRNNILLLLPTFAMSVGFIHILICITKICKNMT